MIRGENEDGSQWIGREDVGCGQKDARGGVPSGWLFHDGSPVSKPLAFRCSKGKAGAAEVRERAATMAALWKTCLGQDACAAAILWKVELETSKVCTFGVPSRTVERAFNTSGYP